MSKATKGIISITIDGEKCLPEIREWNGTGHDFTCVLGVGVGELLKAGFSEFVQGNELTKDLSDEEINNYKGAFVGEFLDALGLYLEDGNWLVVPNEEGSNE